MKLNFIKVDKKYLIYYYFAVQNVKDYLLLISYCVNKKYPVKFIDPYNFRVDDVFFSLSETKTVNATCKLDENLRIRFDNLYDFTSCSKDICYKMCIGDNVFISYAQNLTFEYLIERKEEYGI